MTCCTLNSPGRATHRWRRASNFSSAGNQDVFAKCGEPCSEAEGFEVKICFYCIS
jgi:hypothetical protein